jgi:hypothetical protein
VKRKLKPPFDPAKWARAIAILIESLIPLLVLAGWL